MDSRDIASGLLLGLLAAGCGFQSSPSGEPPGDASPTGTSSCAFATLLAVDTCRLAFDGDLVIPGGTAVYDTAAHTVTLGSDDLQVTHTMVSLGTDTIEVISARNLTLAAGARLEAIGPLPLVIAVSGDIVVGAGAQIDVSYGGAGAQPSCAMGPTPGESGTGGGGGGGGGGFGANGGSGGKGNNGGTLGTSAGGVRGQAVTALPSGLRGGCPGDAGGDGGLSGVGGAGGRGGDGGGALYLVAAGRIELGSGAAIHAGGSAGLGGRYSALGSNAGGGGGGSGGMLLLEAPHIVGPEASIAANGGGGGGGADSFYSGGDGAPALATTSRAAGGKGTASTELTGAGVDGGRGGSKDGPAGEDVVRGLSGGGGGGGGGVGIIRLRAADLQVGMTSPDPR